MALEEIGRSAGLQRLVDRIKKKYPNYNFDVPTEYNTQHKSPYLCKDNKITHYDTEGNIFCGTRYKLKDEVNPYTWEWATCNALIEKGILKNNEEPLPF